MVMIIYFIFSFNNFCCVIVSFLTKLLVSVALILLVLFTNSLYPVFLATSLLTTLLSLLKSTGVVSNFSMSNLFTLLYKLFKPLGRFFNLSMSNLPTSDFQLA